MYKIACRSFYFHNRQFATVKVWKVIFVFDYSSFSYRLRIFEKEVKYLGHVITTGVKPNPENIEAVQNYPLPTTSKEIKGFIGLVPQFSTGSGVTSKPF